MASVTISRKGFGQVEPNHLSGIVTGEIYAQLPVAKAMGSIIENGRFAKYDYAKGEVNLTGAGEWMLIYNEEKKYDERFQNHKDFAMRAETYTDGEMVPRLIKTKVGDIFTTNAFGASEGKNSPLTGPVTTEGFDVVGVTFDDADLTAIKFGVDAATGYLTNDGYDEEGPIFGVAKVYTMADGQPGLKLYRIA